MNASVPQTLPPPATERKSRTASLRLIDPFTGAGALTLAVLGGPRVEPAHGYMGGKRKLSTDILGLAGVRPGQGATEVYLCDAGPLGWVWTELVEGRAALVAEVLRSWEGRSPVELWEALAARPPDPDPTVRAAQVLWLQARTANSSPVRWVEELGQWRMDATGRAAQFRAHSGQRLYKRGETGRPRGVQSTTSVARRIERIAALLARQPVHFHHGDVFGAIPEGDLSDCIAILDPPYQGATSYAADCPRWRVLALAEDLRARGAWVLICEAEPLSLPGWFHVEITRPGGKPEWVTCSRPPVRLPSRPKQGSLFDLVAP